MVPVLSKLYQMLPQFIKNNSKMIKLVQTFNNNNKFRELDSHYMMLDYIFNSCDIKATGTMREIQLLLAELLRLVDNVCQKHDIEYWIDYGTFLGAVRHRGFVPWDDDLDISMLRKDYDKFVEVFPKEIEAIDELKDKLIISKLTKPHENYPEGSNILDVANEGTFILFFQCAFIKPYVHFDVFPKEYIEDSGLNPQRNELQTRLQVELRNKIASGEYDFDEGLQIQRKKLQFTYDKTAQISDAVDGLHNNIQNRIYKTDYIFPLKKVEFEGYEFNAPKEPELYLPLIYGPEYMHIPHIINSHNTVPIVKSQFENEKEIRESFEESIELLRSINDNFK